MSLQSGALSVLHVTTVHQPLDVRIYYKEVRALKDSGVSVGLATTVQRPGIHAGVPLIALGSNEGSRWRRIGRDLRALQAMLAHRSAIVHIHDPELLLVAALPAMLGARVVYDVHEFYVERIAASEWIPAPLRRLAVGAYDWIERLVLPRFAGVVIVSDAMRARYERFVPKERVALVRNFPNLDAAELARARASAHPLGGTPYVIHTGGAMKLRAFHCIVEAAETLRAMGSPLRIANLGAVDLSDYAPEERESLRARAEAAGVALLGQVPYAQAQVWMAHALAGYLPLIDTANNRRGMPNKLFEYLLFSLPVVATDIGRVAEIVTATASGELVPLEDGRAAGVALQRVALDPRVHDSYAAAAEAAARTYSFDGEFGALAQLYDRIATPA